MKTIPAIGQKAKSMFTAHPVIVGVSGVIGLAAIIGIVVANRDKKPTP